MVLHQDRYILSLFGPFCLFKEDGTEIRIGSAKQKIILALLVTAPNGKRSRSFLEDMLWSITGREQAQGNLRQAIMGLRRVLNIENTEIVSADHTNVWLDRTAFLLHDGPDGGIFLEGINLPHEKAFDDWVKEQRQRQHVNALIDATNALRPTIAVLPFRILGEPANDFGLSDMLAESLSHALSRSSIINVISHLSTTRFNRQLDALADIRTALNADYVVTGRLMVDGDTIHVQSETAHCMSSRIQNSTETRFSLKGFLTSDSSVVEDISTGVGRALFASSVANARTESLGDVACHDLMMAAIFQMHRQNFRWFSEARERMEEVVRRVPNSSLPLAWLSKWYVLSLLQGWSENVQDDHIAKAKLYVAKALELNPTCSFALTIDGFVHNNLLKQYDTAMSRFDDALSVEPNNPLSWLLKGTLLAFMDEGDKAVSCTDRARRLSPIDPHKYFFDSLSATAALANRDYGSALSLANASLDANANHISTRRVKTIALQKLGRVEEAQKSAAEICRLDRTFTIKKYLHNHAAANFETGQDWADALRAAGVRET